MRAQYVLMRGIAALIVGVVIFASTGNVIAGTNYIFYTEDVGPANGYAHTPYGHTNHLKGDRMRLQFSNNITTPVTVNVNGEWRSDT